MFTLQLGVTDKARNSTKITEGLSTKIEVSLKENTSIISPTFELRCDFNGMPYPSEIFGYNYCYCPEFKRYYFITDIISETSRVFYIDCQVDVLATFRDDILNTNAFILYAESKFNSMITDTRLPVSLRSTREHVKSEVSELDSEGCFILTLAVEGAGNNGSGQSFVLSVNEMKQVTSKLYSTDFLEQISKFFSNPMDTVISCMWIPVRRNSAGIGIDNDMVIGDYNLGRGGIAQRTIRLTPKTIKPYVKYKSNVWNPVTESYEFSWADYRNCEPVSEYTIYLPGVGIVQLNMRDIIGEGKYEPEIMIDITVSPITGSITYVIQPSINGGTSESIENSTLICNGNIGVKVPVASTSMGYMSALGNMGSALVKAIATAFTGSPLLGISAITDMISSAIDMGMMNTTVSGSIDGWNMTEDMLNIFCYTEVKQLSDDPVNITNTIGRPLYKKYKLGDMKGLVKCTGAYVKTWATEAEHQMIAQYVNSSTNFIFGGLIIE